MSYAINDLIRVSFEWRDTRWSNVMRNVVHFRGYSGEVPDSAAEDIILQLASVWVDRFWNNLCTTTSLRRIVLQNVRKASCPDEERTWDQGVYNGNQSAYPGDFPQLCACITRKSYVKGRKGIGHFYFGPLPQQYTSLGEVVIDPLLVGDLNDVLDALGDPVSVTGFVMRPIVHPSNDDAPYALQDTRTHRVAPLAVMLKSRRIGIGE